MICIAQAPNSFTQADFYHIELIINYITLYPSS